MPLYRYECIQCGEEFTALTSLGRENEIKCKRCGSSQLKKLLPRFFTGKTSEGAIQGAGGCSTCSATSCRTCGSG